MCECDRCKRFKRLYAIAEKLPQEDRSFLIALHGDFDTVEMELDIRNSVIAGTWKGSDQWIADARST